MSYKGFISYSHAADGKLAPQIQRGLHRLGKPWYKLRAVRIFRDKTGLSATPALWPSIELALASSEFFLLLASPGAANSVWVQKEVEYWVQHKQREKLLIVLTDGDLAWGGTDFDWSRTTALPPNLQRAFRDEPLYVDLRWARTADQVSLRNPAFRESIADLAAPLHGKSKDELVGEDIRQHRIARALAWTAACCILLLAAAFGWQWWQASLARDSFAQQLADRLYEDAHDAAQPGWDQRLALHLALRAARTAPDSDPRRRQYIDRALHLAAAMPVRVFNPADVRQELQQAVISDNLQSILATTANHQVVAWDLASGERLPLPWDRESDGGASPVNLAYLPVQWSPGLLISPGSRWGLLAAHDTTVWDLRSGETGFSGELEYNESPAFSRDGQYLIVRRDECEHEGQRTPNSRCCRRVLWAAPGAAPDCAELDEAFDHAPNTKQQVLVYRGSKPYALIEKPSSDSEDSGGDAAAATPSAPWIGMRKPSDGHQLLTLDRSGSTWLWDLGGHPFLTQEAPAQEAAVKAAAFDPSGGRCVTVTSSGKIILRQLNAEPKLYTADLELPDNTVVEIAKLRFNSAGDHFLLWFTVGSETLRSQRSYLECRASNTLQLKSRLPEQLLGSYSEDWKLRDMALAADATRFVEVVWFAESENLHFRSGTFLPPHVGEHQPCASSIFGGLTADGEYLVVSAGGTQVILVPTTAGRPTYGPFPFRDPRGVSLETARLLRLTYGIQSIEDGIAGRLAGGPEFELVFDPAGARLEIAKAGLGAAVANLPLAFRHDASLWAGWEPQNTFGGVLGTDRVLLITDARTGYEVGQFLHPETDEFVFSQDDQWILSVASDGGLRQMYAGGKYSAPPDWMEHMAEALTGQQLLEDLTIQTLSPSDHARSRQQFLNDLEQAAENGDELASRLHDHFKQAK